MARRTIEELLDFLNRFSYERSLTWEIPHVYEEATFEIQWLYDKSTDLNFYFRKIEDEEKVWTNTTTSGLMQLMVDEKVDLADFELQLLKVIGVQVVCCHYFIEKASDLIGSDKVEQIIKLIDEITNKDIKTKAPRLKVVPRKKKDEDE